MNPATKPIPDGFHTLTPYLAVRNATAAIDFYKAAFSATERFRMPGPEGKGVGHAELVIGNSIVMLSDEWPDCGALSPQTLNGTPVSLVLYVEDVDASFAQALAAGAAVLQPLEDKFYGDRAGMVIDPYGHKWCLMTHKLDLTPEEIDQRFKEECAQQKGPG